MLKGLVPITTLIIAWFAALTKSSTSKLVNIAIIAIGVLLSSLGEVSLSWTGLSFQLIGIVAESAHLVLIQWLLTAHQENLEQNPQRITTSDIDAGLASNSSSSNSNGDHGSNDEEVGASYASYCDVSGRSSLPTHDHGAPRISRDDCGRDRDDEGDMPKMSTLSLIYYYAPTWALLIGLAALIFEAPEFNWRDLDRMGVGMLALSGGLAFLSNLTTISLVRRPPPPQKKGKTQNMQSNKSCLVDWQSFSSGNDHFRHPQIAPPCGCFRHHLDHSNHTSSKSWLSYFSGGHATILRFLSLRHIISS